MARLPHNRTSDLTRARAKSLRRVMTDEEVLLWAALKSFRQSGYAFRKQAPVGPFIADFLCRKAKLVIEVDGRHHDTPTQIQSDDNRDRWMFDNGYRVMRFAAREIWQDMDAVVRAIEDALGI
ncbi:MAG: endonuclease domain-containing protein [Litorimonas sp.]